MLFYIFLGFSIIALSLWLSQVLLSILFLKRVQYVIPQIIPFISVLIPYFNEKDETIQQTIDSINKQENVKLEIVLVNDGNSIPAKVHSHINLNHISLDTNKGKRFALYKGAKFCNGDYIVVVDSDTVLDKLAIWNLYKTLINEKAGAVCGNIKVLNEKQNLLTKMISAMYWFAFHMERASQSYFGTQIVCSGALSIYLKEKYIEFSEHLTTQKSLGVLCQAGDDRSMTNQFLLHGYISSWSKDAIAHTSTPYTLKSFIKQQIRWTRSFCLELAWMAPILFKFRPIYLFFIFRSLFKYLYILLTMFGILFWAFIQPIHILFGTMALGTAIIISLKGILATYLSKDKFMLFKTAGFGFLGYLVISPFLLYAVLTCRRAGWLTR